MEIYSNNLEKDSLENENFRQVLFTGKHSQLVVMSLNPNEEIGEEVHEVDQFIRIESGKAKFILDGIESSGSDGYAVVIPAGTRHNVINTSSSEKIKLYTVYSPPEHAPGTIHKTKAEAEAAEHHFS